MNDWMRGYMTGMIIGALYGCDEELMMVYKEVKKEMNKNRECMYCSKLFDCKERSEADYCINFFYRNEQAKEQYKKWRGRDGIHKKTEA